MSASDSQLGSFDSFRGAGGLLNLNTTARANALQIQGYGGECIISMGDTAARLVHSGYAVYGIDHEGHGKSTGSKGYISNFSDIVKDCSNYFKSVCEADEQVEEEVPLWLLHGRDRGATAPQAGILCTGMVQSCSLPCARSVRIVHVHGELALQTGRELLTVSLDIEKNLQEVSLPFLVLHGEDDIVAHPSGSKLLHERASSRDKTLKLYSGMWHVLMGERPEDVERVFARHQGTPKNRQALETYVFAMFNENQKPGDATEKHFGLLYPNMSLVYPIRFA
ncbi:hypothetical protein PR202_gb00129 [Eleusine coracana subsp. coracana]|uniref:Serine aminopeptidase S33 domain-containing protein n=1 Tax=Eleusine coracana subsp. coracana TaxID=191504 RepID=A0AAV5DSE5_ELECO|nr:hypothetical protein PR202_gb00129 [Eleusine coracana subsp. coracana]